ncbi:hypothetical protein L3X38_044373 [Prunus dulcis]|uniref:Uncharacterized protein n=1 Tax=Prunus dulcis TaxID=3755 RepID=A0AAD4V0N2_PRUDU|nr:hypothetical protein L3X38_044373 [Prunus dulcis]
MMKKAIQKALGNLKGASPSSKEIEAMAMVSMLKEGKQLLQFKSMFSFISGPNTQSKQSGWSLFSNLMHRKRVPAYKEEETYANVDGALSSFVGHKATKSDNIIENTQNQMQNLELCL